MAKSTNSNYTIILDAELNLKSIDEQLKESRRTIKFDADTKSAKKQLQDLGLTYQQLQLIASKSIETFKTLSEQVFELDGAITEFQKVSDLSGKALDNYVAKLSEAGREVSRTGKPNRSEPVCCDGKAAQRTAPKPLKASRALSLQHEDEICLSVNCSLLMNELVRKQKDDKDDYMVERPK